MEECFTLLRSKDIMVRLQALSKAQNLVEHLDLGEVTELTDISLDLLKDNNFKVCHGILLVLTKAVPSSGEHFKHQLNALLPGVIERLGDGKQPVREAGRRLLLALMEALTPVLIFDKIGDSAWGHKNWRVKEEFTRTCAAALSLFGLSKLPVHKLILPSVLKLLEDSNSGVREASMACIEELFRHMGGPLLSELQRFSIRPAQLKDITGRLEQIKPPPSVSIATKPLQRAATAPATAGRHQSPSKRAPTAESHGPSQTNGVQRTLVFGTGPRTESAKSASTSGRGLTDDDVARYLAATCEKPVTPIKIYSEKELAKEIEKAATILVPEKDWSARMTAMQRLCGLVLGGAAELESFPSLLKQLWEPLDTQLADRRSSIVKLACHLLMLLAQEMHLDFESSAEHFMPSLFKLVVITVLIIAESADSCIKTLLYFCRCARILPKMIDTAMRDRAGVLRTKCCGYALLILDQWREAPEIQKTGQLFEDMIRCCVGDALSEVRAIARQCYQVFALVWPDRARRLFSSLDSSTQKLLQEEQRAGPTPRSPPGKDKPSLFRPPSGAGSREASSREATPREPVGTPASVLKDPPLRTASNPANLIAASEKEGDAGGYAAGMQRRIAERAGPGPYSTQRKEGQPSNDPLRSLTGMLKSASAEDLLDVHKARGPRGHGLSGPMRVDAGGRGPPRDGHVSDDPSLLGPSTPHSRLGGHVLGGGHMAARRVPQRASQSERDSETESVQSDDAPTNRNPEPARQMGARRLPAQPQLPPLTPGGPSKQENPPPAKASRPQPRTSATSASSGSSRPPSSWEDVSVSRQQSRSSEQDDVFGDVWAFSEPVPLSEALASGADPEGTWTNRVQAFQAVVTSLQQDESGSEVAACFKKVMGLYLAHLGEQHHKVAAAALSSLAEVIKTPSCCRLFEGYLERVLPLVSGRLIDTKDNIRQAAARVLDACQEVYTGDVLLQPLIRSLDEQRSVKAKAAVAEYAATALLKPPPGSGEGTWVNPTVLKHWLARLAALTTEKIAKAKEAGAKALVSVYEHLDSNAVLTLVLGLPIEEQVALRHLLKKYTPRIDEDYNQIQALSKKRYKVVPSNGAPVQTDLPAARAPRAASQRSRQEEDVPPAAPESDSEPEIVDDSHSEQTAREKRVKQWVEVEARKALAVPPEALGVRSAGKPTGGTLESVEDQLAEADERALAELQRRLSGSDQQAVSTSNPSEASAGRPKGYAEMFSERRKSLSGAAKDVAGSSGEPPAVDSNSPAKQTRPSIRPANDPNVGNATKLPPPGEVAKVVSPAKRVPQGTPKRQAEPSPLEKLARGVSAEAIEGGGAPVVRPEAPVRKGTPVKTPPKGGTDNARKPEGAVTVLGNGVAVHRLDSFDSDSGSDNGWTEAEGLGGAGLHGKVFQELPDPTRNQRMAALKDVKKACKMGDDALWEKHYWHFYQVVLEALNDDDSNLKERALRMLEKMLTKHGCASDDVAVSVVEKLVVVHRGRTASVSRSAENCLEAVLAQVDPERSLQLLQAMSQSPENRTIVLSISLKQKVIARLSAEELEAHLPSILPELFKQFGSPFPDIRKAVVLCLVEMYMTMGNELIPHLAQLSDMQRRLVSIYAKKISETRSKERHDMEAS